VKPIKPNQIIVAIKDSKLDYDCRRLNLTPRRLFRFYARSGYPPAKIENIEASHELQQQGKKVLHDLIDSDRIISRSSINPALLRQQKLVLAFGGDNHFQCVARYLTDTPILGINADPPRSEGALTQITVNQLAATLHNLERGNYSIKKWTRLAVTLQGKPLPFPGLCETYIGEHRVENMSRLSIQHGRERFLHKGSGMLVYTGSGSTGWAHSVERQVRPGQVYFGPTSAYLRYLCMHPYVGKLSPAPLDPRMRLRNGQEMLITSMNDAEGVIILDALEVYPFPEGSIASIRTGPNLKVIVTQL